MDGVLELNTMATTKRDLVVSLDRQGIEGMEYVRSLRNEKNAPVLLLPASR